MHNSFENLQKRCKNYRLKKVLIVTLPLLIPIVGAGFYLLYPDNTETTQIITPKKQVVISKVLAPKVTVPLKVEKKEIPQTPKHKDLTYSMQIDHTKVAPKPKIKKQKIVEKKQKVLTKTTPQITKEIVTQELPSEKPQTQMIKMSVKSYDSLKQMKELYNNEKKYSLALKIGQKYYDKADYSNALKWSKEANILDHKEEGAWLLYAQSEYAKGNTKRAKKILKLYLGNAQSKEAQSILLGWIREGK